MKKIFVSTITIAALSAAIASLTIAQEAEEFATDVDVLQKDTKTVARRQHTLQDIPISISRFSSEELEVGGISSFPDLQGLVPGLRFPQQGNKNPSIAIRGVGQWESSTTLDPSVAVYLNGIYIPRTDTQMIDIFDAESLEILRGPHGFDFGKNSISGALVLNTKAPHSRKLEGTATTRIGDFGRTDFKASANIPVFDKLSTRVALAMVQRDGYFDNDVSGGDDIGDEDRMTATARALWQWDDTTSVDIFAYYSKQEESGAAFTCVHANDNARTMNLQFSANQTFKQSCKASEAASRKDKISINDPSHFEMTNFITSVTVKWQFRTIDLKSITAFGRQDDILIEDDFDGSAQSALSAGSASFANTLDQTNASYETEARRQFSQELLANGAFIEWSIAYSVGLFMMKEEIEDPSYGRIQGPNNTGFALLLDPPENYYLAASKFGMTWLGTTGNPVELQGDEVAGVLNFTGHQSDLSNISYALHGKVKYELNDWVSIIGAARYVIEEREREVRMYEVNIEALLQNLNGLGNEGNDPYFPDFEIIEKVPHQGEVFIFPNQQIFEQAKAYIADTGLPFKYIDEGRNSWYYNTDTDHESWETLLPLLSLTITPPDNYFANSKIDSLLFYTTINQGFKAGGFSPRVGEYFNPQHREIALDRSQSAAVRPSWKNYPGQLVPFKPEKVNNLEFGVKVDGYNSKLRFNSTLYMMEFKNLQVQVVEPGDGLSDIEIFVSNAHKATVNGLELELIYLPRSELTLIGSANIIDAAYDKFEITLDSRDNNGRRKKIDRSGEDFGATPEISLSVTAIYNYRTDKALIIPRVNARYQSDYYTGIDKSARSSGAAEVDAYMVIDVRIACLPYRYRQLNTTLYINNLLDKRYFIGGFTAAGSLGAASLIRGAPRTIGIEANYHF